MAASAPDSGRPFRIFVGLDMEVLFQDKFISLADVRNAQAILGGPKSPTIPLQEIKRVKFNYRTRLSQNMVELADIHSQRAYSAARDPRWEARSQRNSLQNYRDDQLSIMQGSISHANANAETESFGPPGSEAPTPNVDPASDAIQAYQDFYHQTENFDDLTQYDTEKPDDGTEGDYDAINVSFNISSPQPIAHAYVIAIARVRDDKAEIRDKLWFRELDKIGPEPRLVRMATDGLPPAFAIESVKLYVFRQGIEFPTSFSEKQIALTRTEALEYLVLEHMGKNRGKTLDPRPAWSLAPSELLGSTQPKDFDYPITVKVDAKGRYAGPVEQVIVPSRILPLLAETYFLPALEKGRPVEGVADLNLADFFKGPAD